MKFTRVHLEGLQKLAFLGLLFGTFSKDIEATTHGFFPIFFSSKHLCLFLHPLQTQGFNGQRKIPRGWDFGAMMDLLFISRIKMLEPFVLGNVELNWLHIP